MVEQHDQPKNESMQASNAPVVGVPAVDVRALSRRYGRHWALVDVHLQVPQGSVCLVAGHNGSGKSTLFRVLAGALRPDRGVVRVGGHDAVADRPGLRRQVGLLGHHSFTYDTLTARQNIETFARLAGTFTNAKAIDDVLAEVSLAHRADDAVETFSAGMRKRIAFARLLVQRPRVVLLDEPFGALDPQGFAFVDDLIARFRDDGATVLIASHLIDHVAPLCDRAVTLERGRVTWSGEASEFLGRRRAVANEVAGGTSSASSDQERLERQRLERQRLALESSGGDAE